MGFLCSHWHMALVACRIWLRSSGYGLEIRSAAAAASGQVAALTAIAAVTMMGAAVDVVFGCPVSLCSDCGCGLYKLRLYRRQIAVCTACSMHVDTTK